MANTRTQQTLLYILLSLAILVGFWLRYNCLGCLGFRGDEDLTSLAVKALSESGTPELPSGMIYLRFYPYQWLLSLSTEWLGFSEYSIRLPSVIVGTLLIPTAFYLALRLAGPGIAIVSAIGVAVSFEQVEMARAARMYAPFILVYTLSAYAIYRAHYLDHQRLWSPIAIFLCLMSLALHQLAYSLAIFYLAAILINPAPKRSLSLVLQAGFIGGAFLLIKQIQEHYFYRAKWLYGTLESEINNNSAESGLLGSLIDQITLPEFSLLSQTVASFPLFGALFAIAVAALLAWCWRGSRQLPLPGRIVGAFSLIFAIFHQFNLSLICLAILVIIDRNGLLSLRNQAIFRFTLSVVILFAGWVLIVIIISSFNSQVIEVADLGIRKTLRLLVDYPNYGLFWSFVAERPILALPLALGTLWCLDKVSKAQPDEAALFLLAGFWGVLFANGILETKYEFFRYNLHLDIFYLVIVALGIACLPNLYRSILQTRTKDQSTFHRSPYWLVGAGILVFIGMRPDLALLTSHRGYFEESWIYTSNGMGRYPDFRNPGIFVRERLQPEDRVLVFDPREYWNYIGHVDYWIWSENYESQSYATDSVYRDLYLGIPLIHTLTELQSLLEMQGSGNIWILFSKSRLERTPWVAAEIKRYIHALEEQVAYTGKDRDTVVIKITRDHND